MGEQHDLLIAAVTASIIYFVRLVWKWKTGKTVPNDITIYMGTAVGFALYGLDSTFPWLFSQSVVEWFTKAMAVPGTIGIVYEGMKKANPKVQPPVVQDAA